MSAGLLCLATSYQANAPKCCVRHCCPDTDGAGGVRKDRGSRLFLLDCAVLLLCWPVRWRPLEADVKMLSSVLGSMQNGVSGSCVSVSLHLTIHPMPTRNGLGSFARAR